jgi:hypothetical protein
MHFYYQKVALGDLTWLAPASLHNIVNAAPTESELMTQA